MKPKAILRMAVDAAMTGVLLCLMAYSLVGEKAHEWLGVAMLILFVTHHILNGRWSKNLFKGRYAPFRIAQTTVIALMLVGILGSGLSGVAMSKHVFPFLNIPVPASTARKVHMLCAYWGYVFMSLHLGFHWNRMIAMGKKALGTPSKGKNIALRLLGIAVAGYGVYAFSKRRLGSYLLLKIPFVFFDFSEPRIFFFLDYIAVMGLFVWFGHYLAKLLQRSGGHTKEK